MPNLKLEDLNRLYHEAEQVDKDIFSEQRSNLLLVAGEHYTRRYSRYWHRIRDNRDLTDQQRLRLTKNHTQVVSKKYKNNILTYSPGVSIRAKNESEIQDQKSAELRQAVWQDAKIRYKLNRKIRDWCSQYVDAGECGVKIFYDPNRGEFKGYEQAMDENGMPQSEEDGTPTSSGNPVFGGEFVFEDILGFNLLRDASAKSMEESPWIGLRKMVDIKTLEKMIGDDADKKKAITAEKDDTYMVFDNTAMGYKYAKEQTLVKEFYWKPSHEYPNGYFYIFTEGGILWEGELPYGIFPILVKGFDETPTSPRGRSIIKQIRPYQAEINRAASKIAEHQISLGDDKVFTQGGTTVAHGGVLPGVRNITFTGAPPIIMAGRDGSQYLGYMNSQIDELYRVAQVEEDGMEKNQQLEPYALLYQSLKQKKVFSTYAAKFEEFLVDVCELYLKLHKKYCKDEDLILAVGRSEQINIPEYKNSVDLGYQIKIDPQSDDIETKMGKQLTFSTILQYVGPNLDKDDIGVLIKNLPYVNNEESFGDLTLDYENSKNDILALDRGAFPIIHPYDNHVYLVKKASNRRRKSDFDFLDPQIKQNYDKYIQTHEQFETDAQNKIAQAKSEFLPTGGYLVSLDFYVTDPTNPNKTRRARLPSQAVEWLIQKLEAQGMSLDRLESLDTSSKAQIAAQMLSGQPMAMQPPTDQGAGAASGGSSPEGTAHVRGNSQYYARNPSAVLNEYERGAQSTTSPYGLR